MFVIRTIRKGRVKIAGRILCPDQNHLAYDGRLYGMRYAFATYKEYYPDGPDSPFVNLWGSEESFKARKPDDNGPEVVGGYLPWSWWRVKP